MTPAVAGELVRRASELDLPGLLLLYRHLHADDPVLASDMAAATWDRLLASPSMAVIVVALPDGTLAASCTLAVVPNLTRGARPFGVIENVVTHADHRRKGYGTAVLRAAVQVARDADCHKVSLNSGSTREPTLRFYEAAGFDRGTKTYFEVRLP